MTSALQTIPPDDSEEIGRIGSESPAEGEIPDLSATKLRLPQVLRWGGGIVLAAATVAFMFQGFSAFDPMTRHWLMLAVCGLLGLLGLLTGTVIREEKGARVFLAFAAASFPALAAQLGAMLYALLGLTPAGMPQQLVYSPLRAAGVTAVVGLTLLIAGPVSLLAFTVLARPRARLLTGLYMLANLCVLLPVRGDAGVGGIAAALGGLIIWIDITRLRPDFRLGTLEGGVSRALLMLPLAVLLGRTLFYPMSSAFHGSMLVLAGAYLTFFWGISAGRHWLRVFFQAAGQVVLAAGWLTCMAAFVPSLNSIGGMSLYLAVLPLAVSLGVQSLLTSGRVARMYLRAAVIVAAVSVGAAHMLDATPIVSVTGIAVALVIAAVGTMIGETRVFLLGALTAAIGLGNFVYQAFRHHSDYAWAALAFIGIAAMFSASLIEKKQLWQRFKVAVPWGGSR